MGGGMYVHTYLGDGRWVWLDFKVRKKYYIKYYKHFTDLFIKILIQLIYSPYDSSSVFEFITFIKRVSLILSIIYSVE